MTNSMVPSTFLQLPAELIQHVLGYLEPFDLVNVAKTCRILQGHSYDDRIWQPLVNRELSRPTADTTLVGSFRELYIAHHPHWFLTRNRIWFADSEPGGKLIVCRYDPEQGCIVGHSVIASRGHHTLHFWEKFRDVIVHSFNPRIALDMHRPVLKLSVDGARTDDTPNSHPSDRAYAPPSKYSKEILMETFNDAGLYGSFMFCRTLPAVAISEGTSLWPPLRFPANVRTRNETRDGYNSSGHRPSRLGEVSQDHFRLRKWVEYTGRRTSPSWMSFTSPNGLSAALGLAGPYFAAAMNSATGGVNIRMPEDITTYATLPEWSYAPSTEKPWQGIWCGDYSGHGCEFLLIRQPDKQDQRPLPDGMDWLSPWFRGHRSDSSSSHTSAQEDIDSGEATRERAGASLVYDEEGEPAAPLVSGYSEVPWRTTRQGMHDYENVPTGRLEAIKLTGDPNVPRGEYTFIAPDIGHGGFMRVANEEIFRGARIVKSAGHIAGRGFRHDQYIPSQLIMISHDTLAQFWEGFGHISYYRRVDLDALIK